MCKYLLHFFNGIFCILIQEIVVYCFVWLKGSELLFPRDCKSLFKINYETLQFWIEPKTRIVEVSSVNWLWWFDPSVVGLRIFAEYFWDGRAASALLALLLGRMNRLVTGLCVVFENVGGVQVLCWHYAVGKHRWPSRFWATAPWRRLHWGYRLYDGFTGEKNTHKKKRPSSLFVFCHHYGRHVFLVH